MALVERFAPPAAILPDDDRFYADEIDDLSSRLDPLESDQQTPTNDSIRPACYGRPEFDPQPATALERHFRHSGWAKRRELVWQSMQRCLESTAKRNAFACCGANVWLQRAADNQELRLVGNCCHDRWCTPCASARARLIKSNLNIHLKEREVRFITLTLRHSRTPLIDQLRRLTRSFIELRRRVAWKSHVHGGAAFIEVKLSNRDGLWHPHLHILCEGIHFEKRLLSMEWLAVTGDSSIVDITLPKVKDDVAYYVTKYVTKPASEAVVHDPNAFDEMRTAMRGKPLCLTFGTWRSFKLTEKHDDGREWKNLQSLDSLLHSAYQGDKSSIETVTFLAKHYPDLPWPAEFVITDSS